jgi:hypothetical protein
MDSNFNEKILDRIYRINMIFLCSDHFPASSPLGLQPGGKKVIPLNPLTAEKNLAIICN